MRPDELQRLTTPTLLIWGEREPLGRVPTAEALTALIPHARLQVLPTGHGPWLGEPARTATPVGDFLRPDAEQQRTAGEPVVTTGG